MSNDLEKELTALAEKNQKNAPPTEEREEDFFVQASRRSKAVVQESILPGMREGELVIRGIGNITKSTQAQEYLGGRTSTFLAFTVKSPEGTDSDCGVTATIQEPWETIEVTKAFTAKSGGMGTRIPSESSIAVSSTSAQELKTLILELAKQAMSHRD